MSLHRRQTEPERRSGELREWTRSEKLAWIEAQIASGDLVVRRATAEERARYGITPHPREPARKGRRPPSRG